MRFWTVRVKGGMSLPDGIIMRNTIYAENKLTEDRVMFSLQFYKSSCFFYAADSCRILITIRGFGLSELIVDLEEVRVKKKTMKTVYSFRLTKMTWQHEVLLGQILILYREQIIYHLSSFKPSVKDQFS